MTSSLSSGILFIAFRRTITAREIAEPLISFDAKDDLEEVLQFARRNDFDTVGIRKVGCLCGYLRRSDLERKEFRILQFKNSELVDETAPISKLFILLSRFDRVYVKLLGAIGGIITKADMQKLPIRMWLFGMISLLEMQMLRLIRKTYTDDCWKRSLAKARIDAALRVFKKQKNTNTQTTLEDCLSLYDKCKVVHANAELRRKLKLQSNQAINDKKFRKLYDLRNDLAHSHKVIIGDWADFTNSISSALRMLELAERI